jgi:uncharacterized protein YcfL
MMKALLIVSCLALFAVVGCRASGEIDPDTRTSFVR